MKWDKTSIANYRPITLLTVSSKVFENIIHSRLSSSPPFFLRWGPTRTKASPIKRFLDYTQRRNTVSRTPLDEWSARRWDLYLTTHNIHKRQTSMLPPRFEPIISVGERSQTHVLDRAATGTVLSQHLHTVTYCSQNNMVLGKRQELNMLPSDLQIEYSNPLTEKSKLHVFSVIWQSLLSVSWNFVT
jgi:hypothetical protein